MKYACVVLVVIICFLALPLHAAQYQIGFRASHEAVETDFTYIRESRHGALSTGIGLVYNKDDYTILRGGFMLASNPFLPGLRYGVGFEPAAGKIDKNNDTHDGDLLAFGFLLQMAYDLYTSDLKVPVDLLAELTYAPDPLTSHESTMYGGARLSGEYRILTNAGISFEYRYLRVTFDDKGGDWTMSDHIYLLGYTMRF